MTVAERQCEACGRILVDNELRYAHGVHEICGDCWPGFSASIGTKKKLKGEIASLPWDIIAPAAGCAAVLIVGIAGRPFVYYQFMRIATTTACAWLAYCAKLKRNVFTTCLFAAIALVFNPIVPFRFDRSVWRVIDACAAVAVPLFATSLSWRRLSRPFRFVVAFVVVGALGAAGATYYHEEAKSRPSFWRTLRAPHPPRPPRPPRHY